MSGNPSFAIHPAAVEEAEEATRWYRQRSAQAADDFVQEVTAHSRRYRLRRNAGPPVCMVLANSCFIDFRLQRFTVSYLPLSRSWPLLMAVVLAKTGALREINNIAAAISARLCYKS